MASSPELQLSEVISVKSAKDQLQEILGADDASAELRNDLSELVKCSVACSALKEQG